MKIEHAASAVVANNRGGGKESNVELYIALLNGSKHQHCWKISGYLSVSRNGYPFRVERNWMNTDKVAFVYYLASEISRQIREHYDHNCNVDPNPIVNFINEEVNKFIKDLNL